LLEALLADIGATQSKRANPVAEQLSHRDAAAFGRYLATQASYALTRRPSACLMPIPVGAAIADRPSLS
jgi:hypothetical protein